MKVNVLISKKCRSAVRHLERLPRRGLRLLFGFDRWHLSALSERPYALDVIRYLNGLPGDKRQRAVEIGCGLGDIIRRLRFEERLGLDREKQVLSAARWLGRFCSAGRVRFEEFSFPQSPLEDCWDALILVNWIHHVPPAVLKEKLSVYFRDNLRPGGVIVLDTVQDPAYEFNHRIDMLNPSGRPAFRLGEYQWRRELWSIQKE